MPGDLISNDTDQLGAQFQKEKQEICNFVLFASGTLAIFFH